MRLRGAAGLTLTVAVLLSACARPTTGPVNRKNSWTHPGELRIAGRQQPDNLNPIFGTQTVDADVSMFWAGYLFLWSDRNEFVPELATRVPSLQNGDIAPDGLRIRYHLRHGVQWQDGAPFTADDVIYTWQQIMNPRNAVVSRFGYDLVSRIDKLDDYTIDVHLKKKFSPFVATFFSMANRINCILPKHLLDKYADLNRVPYNSMPVGTGPFRLVANERGSALTFVASELYWRGRPGLKKITYRIVESDNTMLTLLRTHEIDFYYRAAETQAPMLRNLPGTHLVMTPFMRFTDLGMNAANPALSDRRVRQALAYAIDRRDLIGKVTQGIAIPGDSNQPVFSWAYDPNVPRYPYDPQRAAALLDAAGWRLGSDGIRYKQGEPLHLNLVGFTGSQTAADAEVLIQNYWHQAGVDVSIKNFSSAQLYATLATGGIEQSGKFDVAFENWSNGTDPDDSVLFRCTMAPPAGWNIYHFCNRDLDAAQSAALSEYDQNVRKKYYAREQEIIATELPIVVLWYQRELDVVNDDFAEFKPAHAATPFWNTWEWRI